MRDSLYADQPTTETLRSDGRTVSYRDMGKGVEGSISRNSEAVGDLAVYQNPYIDYKREDPYQHVCRVVTEALRERMRRSQPPFALLVTVSLDGEFDNHGLTMDRHAIAARVMPFTRTFKRHLELEQQLYMTGRLLHELLLDTRVPSYEDGAGI